MATDKQETFKTLLGINIAAATVEQARYAARAYSTKLLQDATKEELDQYKHRFGAHYGKPTNNTN